MVIFRPQAGGLPHDDAYKAALEATASIFGPDTEPSPDDVDALRRYYTQRYARRGSDFSAFGEEIQTSRRDLNFPKVAERFQMIENDHTQPVVVIRTGTADDKQAAIERYIELLRSGRPCGPSRG